LVPLGRAYILDFLMKFQSNSVAKPIAPLPHESNKCSLEVDPPFWGKEYRIMLSLLGKRRPDFLMAFHCDVVEEINAL